MDRPRRSPAAAVLVAAALSTAGEAAAATVVVEALGLESDAGAVVAGLCVGGLAEADCATGQRAPARPGVLRFTFRQVPAGAYAVAVYHDVNGDGRLDRSPLGLPLEPYGFSNEAGRRGRPSFEAAAVEVSEPTTLVRVRVARIASGR